MIAIELTLTVSFYCTHMQLYVIHVETQAGCMRGVRAMLHVFAGCHRDPSRRWSCCRMDVPASLRYMSRGVLYDASTVGCIAYFESVSRPKLYTGLYMYNKIKQYLYV